MPKLTLNGPLVRCLEEGRVVRHIGRSKLNAITIVCVEKLGDEGGGGLNVERVPNAGLSSDDCIFRGFASDSSVRGRGRGVGRGGVNGSDRGGGIDGSLGDC